MSERSFEIRVGGRSIELELCKCAVTLFRTKNQVDFITVDNPDEEDKVINIFNNEEFARWLGGYMLVEEDGVLERPTMYMEGDDGVPRTFREITGWNPTVIEMEQPLDWHEEAWLDVQMRHMDEEMEGL